MVQGAFKREVQVGRIVLLNSGADAGKLAVIIDIVDHNRALIDGPTTGVARQAFSYNHLTLTPLVVKELPRGAGEKVVKKYLAKSDAIANWEKSAWAQKIATRKTRASLSDFDRFKVQKFKAQRRFAVGSAIHQAKKQAA
ncbi:ribosomal protein L14-domain-containing protein [Halteromyces radiatus]|uniref:ribosomal protein L14-domain-containing protein n=1 Tax=Halteromyces radiatus TaxID=101107 RepID=UPI00221E3AAA|nr:ribosomal protein L14-domain-containing protein [Halteromyces radiatus]KAI8098634.1 ribosomal protein L14-domain-containing protein [Halteromyces radiatus]